MGVSRHGDSTACMLSLKSLRLEKKGGMCGSKTQGHPKPFQIINKDSKESLMQSHRVLARECKERLPSKQCKAIHPVLPLEWENSQIDLCCMSTDQDRKSI